MSDSAVHGAAIALAARIPATRLGSAVEGAQEGARAYALLICASKEERTKRPDDRPRLTVGPRKEHGRWIVQHELIHG